CRSGDGPASPHADRSAIVAMAVPQRSGARRCRYIGGSGARGTAAPCMPECSEFANRHAQKTATVMLEISESRQILVHSRMRFDPGPSLPTAQSRQRAALSRTASALLLLLVGGIVGCAEMGSKPSTTPGKKEPYLLLKLNERRLYVKDDDATKVPPDGVPV